MCCIARAGPWPRGMIKVALISVPFSTCVELTSQQVSNPNRPSGFNPLSRSLLCIMVYGDNISIHPIIAMENWWVTLEWIILCLYDYHTSLAVSDAINLLNLPWSEWHTRQLTNFELNPLNGYRRILELNSRNCALGAGIDVLGKGIGFYCDDSSDC